MNAFSFDIGSEISAYSQRWIVKRILGPKEVLADHCETGQPKVLPIAQIGPPIEPEKEPVKVLDLEQVNPEAWSVAVRRYEALRPYLRPNKLSEERAIELGKELGASCATIYRWRDRLQAYGNVTVLLPGHRLRRRRSRRLDPAIEAIISSAIELYEDKQRLKPEAIVREVEKRCKVAKLKPPAPNSVRRRIEDLDEGRTMSKRLGWAEARNRRLISKGPFEGADGPMAVIQIDHTPLDILVVDEETRSHTFRVWLTIAIDVFSRAIVGFYLSLEAPNAASVGLCIVHASLPKDDWLAELGIDDLEWPMYGKPAKIFTDNAQEFRSNSLERSCTQRGIQLEYRRPGKPSDGGIVERVIGTINAEVHKLPGTTFSNPQHRGKYDSVAHASMTLKALTQWFVRWIVGEYHNRVHSGIGTTPSAKWAEGLTGTRIALGKPPLLISDAERFKIDFLPSDHRTIQNYGVRMEHLKYSADELLAYRRISKKKDFVIRFDPANAKYIYLYIEEEDDYLRLTCTNLSSPALPFAEFERTRKDLLKKGHESVSTELLIQQTEMRKQIIEDEKQLTKTERRRREQAKNRKTSAPLLPKIEPKQPPAEGWVPPDGNHFGEPPVYDSEEF